MSKVQVQIEEVRMTRYRVEIETSAAIGWTNDTLAEAVLALVEAGPEKFAIIKHIWIDPPDRINVPSNAPIYIPYEVSCNKQSDEEVLKAVRVDPPHDAKKPAIVGDPARSFVDKSGLPKLGNLLDKAVSFGEEMGKVAAKAKPTRPGKPTPNGQRQKYSDEFCLKVFKAYKASGWAKTEREFALPAATLSYLIKRAEKALAAQAAAPLSEQLPDDAPAPAPPKSWAERVLEECRKECDSTDAEDIRNLACACAVVAERYDEIHMAIGLCNSDVHIAGTRRLRNPMTRDICQRILERVGE